MERRDQIMNKRIKVTEYQCSPTTFDLDEFIKAQCVDAKGNHIMPEDGGMSDEEIDRMRSLAIGESMPLGDPEAGLTVVRLPNGVVKGQGPEAHLETLDDGPEEMFSYA
jgi:hypothetical protein